MPLKITQVDDSFANWCVLNSSDEVAADVQVVTRHQDNSLTGGGVSWEQVLALGDIGPYECANIFGLIEGTVTLSYDGAEPVDVQVS